MFIFYSTNTFEGDRIGTYIVVDRLLDPYTVQGKPHTVVVNSTLDEDIFDMTDINKTSTGIRLKVLFTLKRVIGSMLCTAETAMKSRLIISAMPVQKRMKLI